MKKSLRISGLLAALWAASGSVDAAGLGKMTVLSALGQPLRAEIELLSVQPEEAGVLKAELASAEAYRMARMERSEALRHLQFNIDRRPDGRHVLRVYSTVPLNEPFLDMLIELSWNSGRVLREYTVLLDPPASPKPALAEVARPRAQALVGEAAQRAPTAAAPAAERALQRAQAQESTPAPMRVYGPIKAGETLRSIAAKVQPEDVTLEMMMASLYQVNRHAFLHDNVNLLKKGQVLQVPDRDQIMRMYSPAQARALVREHTDRWQRYRGEVSETAAQRLSTAVPDKGLIEVARPQPPVAPAPAPGQDVLRLSKGDPGAVAADAKWAQQRIQSLEEELAARNRALQEANERVAQLERTVRDLQRLLELKAQEASAPAAAAEVLPAKPAPPAPVTAPVRPLSPPPVPEPEPEKGWMDTLLENPLYLGGGVAAVLLSILLGSMLAGRRRRKDLAKFEQSVMTGGDEFKTALYRTGAPAAAGAAGVAAAASTAALGSSTDFSRLGMGSIDTNEVDPIAEAEVYMAYGRDAQAEEILKEALAKEPGRHEITLKLLEIYAARKDVAAFEVHASELYASLGGKVTPEWEKAAQMGRTIDPDNPLYAELAVTPFEPPTPAPAQEMPSGGSEAPPPAASEEATPAASLAETDASLDFSPSSSSAQAAEAAPEPAAEPEAIEFEEGAPPASATDLDAPLEFDVAPDLGAPPATTADAELEIPDLALEAEPAGSADAAQDAASADLDFTPADEPPAETSEPSLELDMDIADLDLTQLEEALGPAPGEPAKDELDELDALAPEKEGAEALPELSLDAMDEAVSAAPASAQTSLVSEPAASTQPESEALPDLGFADLDLSLPEEEAPKASIEPAMPELDLSGIDLDLGSEPAPMEPAAPESAAEGQADLPELETIEMVAPPALDETAAKEEAIDPELWEEVNTKLDLARAYLEMGDKEGAREILLEAQSEGDAQQRQEAARLLAETE